MPVPGLEARSEPGTRREGMTMKGLLAAYGESDAEYARSGSDVAAYERHRLGQEISERLALPLMCLAVGFAGAPVGARTRRSGRSHTFGWGFAIVAAYFVLQRSVEEFAIGLGLASTIFLGQLPNVALVGAGAVLLWRVDRV